MRKRATKYCVLFTQYAFIEYGIYSHLSNKLGDWNKREGWDFVEKTNA